MQLDQILTGVAKRSLYKKYCKLLILYTYYYKRSTSDLLNTQTAKVFSFVTAFGYWHFHVKAKSQVHGRTQVECNINELFFTYFELITLSTYSYISGNFYSDFGLPSCRMVYKQLYDLSLNQPAQPAVLRRWWLWRRKFWRAQCERRV